MIPMYDDFVNKIETDYAANVAAMTEWYTTELETAFTSLKEGVSFPIKLNVKQCLTDVNRDGVVIIRSILNERGFESVQVDQSTMGYQVDVYKNGTMLSRSIAGRGPNFPTIDCRSWSKVSNVN